MRMRKKKRKLKTRTKTKESKSHCHVAWSEQRLLERKINSFKKQSEIIIVLEMSNSNNYFLPGFPTISNIFSSNRNCWAREKKIGLLYMSTYSSLSAQLSLASATEMGLKYCNMLKVAEAGLSNSKN